METNININTTKGNNQPENELLKFIFYCVLFVIACFYLIPLIETLGFFKVLFIYIAGSVVKETIEYVFSQQTTDK